MQRVQVDPPFRDLLVGANGNLELCDPDGNTLGYFVPCGSDRRVYDWAKGQMSAEDVQERKREVGNMSTDDVLARLKDE